MEVDSAICVQHFILTRFNLLLWNKDKEGRPVRSRKWLDNRFFLFEKYCLPSIKNQTCQDFEWIVLFDGTTPEEYKKKVENFQKECPQLVSVYVEPQNGRYFAEIFREEVVKRMISKRIITTYLDNDDALNIRFVEILQKRVESLNNGTFITFTDGYQFYTGYQYVMQIHYPRNHFMSVVEEGNSVTLKTIYGYGSHYYIDRIKGVRIEKVPNLPMWCEVIHERNMGNDAYFLNVKMIKDNGLLRRDFAIDDYIRHSAMLYLCRFLPRYTKTFIRRARNRLFGREW